MKNHPSFEEVVPFWRNICQERKAKEVSLSRAELQNHYYGLLSIFSIDYQSLASILSPTSGQEKLYSIPQDAKKDKHELDFNPETRGSQRAPARDAF